MDASEDLACSEDLLDLSFEEQTELQCQLGGVFTSLAFLYTMGESTSLPEYTAHRLLESICFVLKLDPRDPDPLIARKILAQSAETAFAVGIEGLEEQARHFDALWKNVVLTTPLLKSRALKDTLESLRGFRTRYTPRFFAQDIPADIDYPLSIPVPENIQGITYACAYLEELLRENSFLRLFDVNACKKVLRSIHPDYEQLILNLFEPIAACALGCTIADKDPRCLNLEQDDYETIFTSCSALSERCLHQHLESSARKLSEALEADTETETLLIHLASSLQPRLEVALSAGGIRGVFPC